MRRAAPLLLLLACGRVEIYGPRVFPPAPDAGRPPVPDAGHPPVPDAGQPPFDAGHPPVDGGTCPAPTGTACGPSFPPQSLACIPGLRVISQDIDPMGRQRFVLGFRQPVDHDDPNGATFEQRLWLFHRSASLPTVMLATGYFLYDTLDELSERFDVNELSVEHRFFGDSFPAGKQYDYAHLDIRQAANDLHRIRVAFAGNYPKPWVSTGASKGGMTMVYYRRFFPCDVAGTVAYVAPHSDAELDGRYNTFLDSVGGAARADCRARLVNLQKQLLTNRATLEPFVLAADAGYTIAGGIDTAYENAVVGFNFTYWQYIDPTDQAIGCAALPTGTIDQGTLFAWASAIVGGDDNDLLPFVPYYYQAATELGDAAPYEAPFMGLLQHPGTLVSRNYVLPNMTVPPFNPAPMRDIQDWLSREGNGIVFVYGELDPWSATQYVLGQSKDTFKGIAPGNNHYSQVGDLNATDESTAMQMVERWLNQRRRMLTGSTARPVREPSLKTFGPPLPR